MKQLNLHLSPPALRPALGSPPPGSLESHYLTSRSPCQTGHLESAPPPHNTVRANISMSALAFSPRHTRQMHCTWSWSQFDQQTTTDRLILILLTCLAHFTSTLYHWDLFANTASRKKTRRLPRLAPGWQLEIYSHGKACPRLNWSARKGGRQLLSWLRQHPGWTFHPPPHRSQLSGGGPGPTRITPTTAYPTPSLSESRARALQQLTDLRTLLRRTTGETIRTHTWPAATAARQVLLSHPDYTGYPGHGSRLLDLTPLIEPSMATQDRDLYLTSYHLELTARALVSHPLTDRDELIPNLTGESFADGDVISTWIARLSEGKASLSQALDRWISKWLKYYRCSGENVLIPANVNSNHWIVIRLNVTNTTIEIFDPLGPEATPLPGNLTQILDTLQTKLSRISFPGPWLNNKKGPPRSNIWKRKPLPTCTQHNGYDCALHTAMYCAGLDPSLINEEACLKVRRWLVWAHLNLAFPDPATPRHGTLATGAGHHARTGPDPADPEEPNNMEQDGSSSDDDLPPHQNEQEHTGRDMPTSTPPSIDPDEPLHTDIMRVITLNVGPTGLLPSLPLLDPVLRQRPAVLFLQDVNIPKSKRLATKRLVHQWYPDYVLYLHTPHDYRDRTAVRVATMLHRGWQHAANLVSPAVMTKLGLPSHLQGHVQLLKHVDPYT